MRPSARKEFEDLSDSLIARLTPKIGGLADDPRPPGCRKLHGHKDLWRIRAGDYRVVYINQALRSRPMRLTSGMVEMQAVFAKVRK